MNEAWNITKTPYLSYIYLQRSLWCKHPLCRLIGEIVKLYIFNTLLGEYEPRIPHG